jgi:hypothetical protein
LNGGVHACLAFRKRRRKGHCSDWTIQLVSAQAQKPNEPEIDMSTSMAGSKQKRDDLEVVVKYMKDDLFAKVKFIYDTKGDLAVGGKIYEDYKKKCKDKLGGQGLSVEGHGTYMEAVWTSATTSHIQRDALAQKRSAVYTVMQNKFSGESIPSCCCEQVDYLSATKTYEIQICVKCVLTKNVSCCPLRA